MKYRFNKFGIELMLHCNKCEIEQYYQLLTIFGTIPHYIKCLSCKFNIKLNINEINNEIFTISELLKSSYKEYESDLAGVIISHLVEKLKSNYNYQGVPLIKCAEWEFYPFIKNSILVQNRE